MLPVEATLVGREATGLVAAVKAKGFTSNPSSHSKDESSSLNPLKSASNSLSRSKKWDRFLDFFFRFFRSGQMNSLVTRRDFGGGMNSEIIAPPHMAALKSFKGC